MVIYWDGSIIRNDFGIDYIDGYSKFITNKRRLNFGELVQKIAKVMRLDDNNNKNKRIAQIIYRSPMMMLEGNIKFGSVNIWDDDDMVEV